MPSEAQIKAAANVLAGNLFGQTLSQVPCSVVPSLLSLARAALEAAERVATEGRWYTCEESAYESPDHAAGVYDLQLGQSIVLDEHCSLGEGRWQLVPVTDGDALCPCGKPDGCGDFLGVDCDAFRDKAWRWSDLPKEWQR